MIAMLQDRHDLQVLVGFSAIAWTGWCSGMGFEGLNEGAGIHWGQRACMVRDRHSCILVPYMILVLACSPVMMEGKGPALGWA